MDMNRYSDRDRIPGSVAKSTPDHWVLFIAEGAVLILLGLLAMTVPLIANENVTGVLGWLFLASGATGLAATYWARQAPGFLWSLVSALLAIFVGVVLIENKSEGPVRRPIGMALSRRRPAADDIGCLLPH
jgi:uncharacterized membrane protein HdeD (DUF308 family)